MLDLIIKYYVQILLAFSVSAIGVMIAAVYSLFSGVRALLRNEIIGSYNHYVKKGYIPIYALENVQEMYLAYHRLGGNGTITKLVGEIKKMPSYAIENDINDIENNIFGEKGGDDNEN